MWNAHAQASMYASKMTRPTHNTHRCQVRAMDRDLETPPPLPSANYCSQFESRFLFLKKLKEETSVCEMCHFISSPAKYNQKPRLISKRLATFHLFSGSSSQMSLLERQLPEDYLSWRDVFYTAALRARKYLNTHKMRQLKCMLGGHHH